jgi:hypothetical protein
MVGDQYFVGSLSNLQDFQYNPNLKSTSLLKKHMLFMHVILKHILFIGLTYVNLID